MLTRSSEVAVSGLEIEHTAESKEVILKLRCDTSYEASILYDTLTGAANTGLLKIDLEVRGIKS